MRRLADDSSGVAEVVKKHLEDKLDLNPSDPPELRDAKIKQLKSIYDASEWKAMAGMGKVVQPADMSEKHWGIVMRTNSLLCGVHPPEEVPKEVTLSNGRTTTIPSITRTIPTRKAYYPAFALKPRHIASYDITFSDNSTTTTTNNNPEDDPEDKPTPTEFHIPRFHINDKTNIDIFETQNSHEKSVADSGYKQDGFSSWSTLNARIEHHKAYCMGNTVLCHGRSCCNCEHR